MARSQYVWLVYGGTAGKVIAVFTVKHELSGWLDRRYGPADHRDMRTAPIGVCRFRDSHHHPDDIPVWLNPRTLEPTP